MNTTYEYSPDRLEVAKVILQQLGGRGFLLMTGAKNLVGDNNSLSFTLPPFETGITKARITLMPSDTYQVEFWKRPDVRRPESLKPVRMLDDVYAEDLQEVFRSVTGLDTRLPFVRRA